MSDGGPPHGPLNSVPPAAPETEKGPAWGDPVLFAPTAVSQLWAEQRDLARAVANDVITLQEGLTGSRFNNDELIAGMVQAFEGDPDHGCMGRSAPQRLQRALAHAERLGLELPTLQAIAAERQATDAG